MWRVRLAMRKVVLPLADLKLQRLQLNMARSRVATSHQPSCMPITARNQKQRHGFRQRHQKQRNPEHRHIVRNY